VALSQKLVRVATLDKGKAAEAHTGSKPKLALLTSLVTTARAPAQTAVQLRQQLETQVLQNTATVEMLEAQAQQAKAAANAASAESIAAQQVSKAHKTAPATADYAIKATKAYTTFEAAKQVHQTVKTAVSTGRSV
jgi:hypothetical protein